MFIDWIFRLPAAIRGDAAIEDEPVNQPLLAPLRAIEFDRSPDTSVSDGGGRETIKDIAGF